MSVIDQVLQTVGEAVTIIRTGGNISTYLYINPKGSWSTKAYYERDGMMPTDSGVVVGDLISHLTNYYLITALFEDRRVGEFFYYKTRLFKCNKNVTIRAYNDTTKEFANASTNVPCLIADTNAMTSSDKAIVIPGFGGRDNVYYMYIQSSSGITKNSIIVDGSTSFKVAGNVNPFFAGGLYEVPLKIE